MEIIDYVIQGIGCLISVLSALFAFFTYVRNGRMKNVSNETLDLVSKIKCKVDPEPERLFIRILDSKGNVLKEREVSKDELPQEDVG